MKATIKELRWMTPEELKAQKWSNLSLVPCLEMTDGSIVFPSNHEGTEPGMLCATMSDGTHIYVIPPT